MSKKSKDEAIKHLKICLKCTGDKYDGNDDTNDTICASGYIVEIMDEMKNDNPYFGAPCSGCNYILEHEVICQKKK